LIHDKCTWLILKKEEEGEGEEEGECIKVVSEINIWLY